MGATHSRTTDTTMRSKGYLLASEAARKLGVAPQTMYRWVEQGKIEGTTGSYRRYVRWSSVLKHVGPDVAKARGLHQKDLWNETPHAD